MANLRIHDYALGKLHPFSIGEVPFGRPPGRPERGACMGGGRSGAPRVVTRSTEFRSFRLRDRRVRPSSKVTAPIARRAQPA